MTTTMSTTIIHSPDGDKPRALEDWAAKHNAKLCHLQSRILALKGLMGNQQSITIGKLRTKKANTTLQDERYTLQATIPEPDFEKINAYLGCSNCNKRTETAAGKNFNCFNCSHKEAKSIPRVTFHCEISDGTGTLPITAFTADVEKIFGMAAPDIFRMKHSGDKDRFELLKIDLQASPITVEVAPNTTLSTNNVLQWVLKKVVTMTEASPHSPTVSASQPTQATSPGAEVCSSDTYDKESTQPAGHHN